MKSIIPMAIVLCARAALGAEQEVIFYGDVDGGRVLAISIAAGSDPAFIEELADGSGRVVLIYEDFAQASSVEPVAVVSGLDVSVINAAPRRSTSEPTIEDLVEAANVAGPKKLRATCRDGTPISPSGRSQLTQMAALWRACSRRGGFERWYQTSTRDGDAVVATICRDHRLVAGSGEACGASGKLVRVRNRAYAWDGLSD